MLSSNIQSIRFLCLEIFFLKLDILEEDEKAKHWRIAQGNVNQLQMIMLTMIVGIFLGRNAFHFIDFIWLNFKSDSIEKTFEF